jgi:hypothetical protein
MHVTRAQAPSTASRSKPGTGIPTDVAVKVLKEAAVTRRVKPEEVAAAIDALEKAKLDSSQWPDVVGGSGPSGNIWRLIFTATPPKKGEKVKFGQGYFPLVGAQRWVAETGRIQNGIFLGHLGALMFAGPYSWKQRQMNFDFNQLQLKLGPKIFTYNIKPGQFGTKEEASKKAGPFFLFAYADEAIIVARGRGGGVAMWSRLTSSDEAALGIVQT